MIYGRLDDNLVAWLCEAVDNHTYTLHDTWDVTHPLALYLPAVTLHKPVLDALPVAVVLHSVAQNRVLQTLVQSLADKVGRREVHICHPEWDKVVASEVLLQCIVLDAVRATTLNIAVKIVNLLHYCWVKKFVTSTPSATSQSVGYCALPKLTRRGWEIMSETIHCSSSSCSLSHSSTSCTLL